MSGAIFFRGFKTVRGQISNYPVLLPFAEHFPAQEQCINTVMVINLTTFLVISFTLLVNFTIFVKVGQKVQRPKNKHPLKWSTSHYLKVI